MTLISVDIPVLETERLILREPRLTDLDALVAFTGSDRMRFIGGKLDVEHTWRNLLMSIGHWTVRGYGYWTIEDRETGRIVGRTGVHNHEGEWPEPELGWQVFDGFEGNGYAAEAARAARHHAQTVMGLGPLISMIAVGNERSVRLAERLGATLERGDFQYNGIACLIYRHPKEVI